VLLLLLATPLAASAQLADPLEEIERRQKKLFEKVAKSVVFVSNGRGFGSGFFVSENGLILTNAHVVDGAKTVEVVLHDGRKFKGRTVEVARDDIDLALVKVPLENTPRLPLVTTESLRVGSWVASIGHGRGGVWTFTTGMVSNIYPVGASRPVFQTQIPLNPGSSGGPIINRRGEVVGIVTAGMTESNAINFAIRIDHAFQYLDGLRKIQEVLTIHAPSGVPVFVDGTLVGTGPTIVVSVSKGTHEVFAVIRGAMVKRTVDYPEQRMVVLLAE